MKFKYITVTIIITLVISFFYGCKYFSYADKYKETLNEVSLSGKLTKDFIQDNATQISDSTYLIDNVVLETFDKRQENIEKILDLQFERLQSEQSLLEIWTALITIVFMVFSFYSFFHTDELVKRASQDVDEIKKKLKVSNEIKDEFKKELKDVYDPIKEDLETGKEIIAKAHEIKNVDERLTKVESYESSLQQQNNYIKQIQEDIKRLQNIIRDLQVEDTADEEEGSNS